MQLHKTTTIYFSPTGNTKKYVKSLGMIFSDSCNEIDLTRHESRNKKVSFSENELVIIGSPVYSGRIPEADGNIFRGLIGNSTPAIIIVTYGNREYDDALLELKNNIEGQGFIVMAAGAFIGRHSIMPAVAAERPDYNDYKILERFGIQAKTKLDRLATPVRDLTINGNVPYRNIVKIPFVPTANRKCIKCGICALNCPVCAISRDNPKKIDKNKCIRCFACVHNCPQKARAIRSLLFRFKIRKFKKMLSSKRKEPEYFI